MILDGGLKFVLICQSKKTIFVIYENLGNIFIISSELERL